MIDDLDVESRRHVSESAILDTESLDPDLHYRFVQERPLQMGRLKLKGYRIVRPSVDGVKTIFGEEDKPAEDIIKHGDRVLMAIPKRRHERYVDERRRRAVARLKRPEEQIKALAKERKVKLVEGDEDE